MTPIIFTNTNNERTMIMPDKIIMITEKKKASVISTISGAFSVNQSFDEAVKMFREALKRK